MRPMHDWTAQNLAALAVLVAAGLVAAGVAQREVAARLPDTPPPPASAAGAKPAPPAARPATDAAVLNRLALETVARNPFRPERARPAGRYRLPGTGAPVGTAGSPGAAAPPAQAPPPPPRRPPLPQFRLVGTVTLAGGKGLAAIQVAGGSSRVVNVGDSISGFRLEAVSAAEAKLRSADTTLVIRSSSPAP